MYASNTKTTFKIMNQMLFCIFGNYFGATKFLTN
jgi:hypothetical protein